MEVRDRILNGAANAFGEHGYANTRVEDILLEAGISRPTFYKHFESKDDVFETLSAMHHGAALSLLQQALEESPPGLPRVAAIIETYLRWRVSLGRLGRELDAVTRTPSSHLVRHREAVMMVLRERWQALMVAERRPAADPLVFEALMAAAERLADTLPFEREISEEDIERRKGVLLRIVSATLAGPDERPAPMPSLPPAEPAPRPRRARKRVATGSEPVTRSSRRGR